MRIAFDITHPADLNLLKRLILRLRDEGHELFVATVERGVLPALMRAELPSLDIHRIERYSRHSIGLYLRTGLVRQVRLTWALSRFKPDVAFAAPGLQIGLAGRVLGFPTVGLCDDPELSFDFNLTKWIVSKFLVPEALEERGGRIETFAALREWTYLSPRYLSLDPGVVYERGLEPGRYLFIRSVDNRSRNYRAQTENAIRELYEKGLSKETVVLSLENKALAGLFPEWSVLREPVSDIHSLMFFSRGVISDGDSMAREGAQLGVDSFYCGIREMAANRVLERLGYLRHVTDTTELIAALSGSTDGRSRAGKESRRQKLLESWEDPNVVMYQALEQVAEQADLPWI